MVGLHAISACRQTSRRKSPGGHKCFMAGILKCFDCVLSLLVFRAR